MSSSLYHKLAALGPSASEANAGRALLTARSSALEA